MDKEKLKREWIEAGQDGILKMAGQKGITGEAARLLAAGLADTIVGYAIDKDQFTNSTDFTNYVVSLALVTGWSSGIAVSLGLGPAVALMPDGRKVAGTVIERMVGVYRDTMNAVLDAAADFKPSEPQ